MLRIELVKGGSIEYIRLLNKRFINKLKIRIIFIKNDFTTTLFFIKALLFANYKDVVLKFKFSLGL